MPKQEIIEQINSVLEKVDDEKVLQDMLSLIKLLYNNHKIGK